MDFGLNGNQLTLRTQDLVRNYFTSLMGHPTGRARASHGQGLLPGQPPGLPQQGYHQGFPRTTPRIRPRLPPRTTPSAIPRGLGHPGPRPGPPYASSTLSGSSLLQQDIALAAALNSKPYVTTNPFDLFVYNLRLNK